MQEWDLHSTNLRFHTGAENMDVETAVAHVLLCAGKVSMMYMSALSPSASRYIMVYHGVSVSF